MGGSYANKTKVSAERSRSEIERILIRYEATGFLYGWQGDDALIGFFLDGKRIQFKLKLPLIESYARSPTGLVRTKLSAANALKQDHRQRWRALKLIIHAKLEGVAGGIVTLEQEFLGNIMLPDGATVMDHVAGKLEHAYETGQVPQLLLSAPKEGE